MKYYMNNIGAGKHQNQAAKVNISNIGKNLDEIMSKITAAGLTKEESRKVLIQVMNHNANVEEAIAEVKPVEIIEEPAAEVKTSSITNIRKAVATLANKINGKIKNLSRAFKKAWAIIKGQGVKSKVAGVSFNQKALQRLTRYNPKAVSVELVRESGNAYDINAVGIKASVNNSKSIQIGYLPRELAQYIAKIIDSGVKLAARFVGITGGNDLSYGALIEIQTEKGNI